MGVAVDTNVLVRYYAGDNPELLSRAVRIIDQAPAGGLLLDRLVIAEFTYVLRSFYKLQKTDIISALQALLANRAFSVADREMVKLATDIYSKERPLSFEDCWLLALQQSGEVDGVATFDKALHKRLP